MISKNSSGKVSHASARAHLSITRKLLSGASVASLIVIGTIRPDEARAQATTPNLVSACSGVSLPSSVITRILSPVVNGIIDPLETTLNPVVGFVTTFLPLLPPLGLNASGILQDAVAGEPITLQVLNAQGDIVGPTDRCDIQSDSISLLTPKGISIGGNRITGLGTNGLEASAGEFGSIAFGNSATTNSAALNSIAIGTGANVGAGGTDSLALGNLASATAANSVALGAGSLAARGATSGYTAVGLTGTQVSSGEVSVGTAAAPRQITNVAPGSAPNDAVNVAQLTGVQSQITAVSGLAVLYDSAAKTSITLGGGVAGTRITNVAPATLGATSTDAVNGSQLFATNINVTNNTNATNTLITNINNGSVGPVRYSNLATPTAPNSGTVTNEVTLVGAVDGPVGLHNVKDGVVAAGSNDGVNGGQLFDVQTQITTATANSIVYNDASHTIATLTGVGGTTITNLKAGAVNATSTDAVNGSQLFAVADQVDDLGELAVLYDTTTKDLITLNGGPTGTRITNLTAGALTATSTDAVNGSQLFATNTNVTNNTNAIANLSINIGNGAIGPVQYSNPAAPTVSNGGIRTNDVTLVGLDPTAPVGLHNVANGVVASGSTDGVNGGQLFDVQTQITTATANSVNYDDTTKTTITLGGAGGTTITNVKAGALTTTSTDAVNGSQLNATNTNVTNNTTAITNLQNNISNGSVGPVQYSDAATPTTPNGGVKSNDLTLVGANTAAPVALHNVAAGAVNATSTDAVNGSQLFAAAQGSVNAVTYNTDAGGNRTNTVTLVGGNTAAPVVINNVGNGAVNSTSTEAVNGSQLFATNQTVTNVQNTANTALTLSQNSVQYDSVRTSVTLNSGGSPTTIRNVASGVAPTDAVNVMQLGTSVSNAISTSNAYTDARIAAINFDLRSVRRDANAGTAGALAAAGLPQAYEAGKGMIAIGGGVYLNGSAVAFGFSKAFNDGHTVVKLGGTYDSSRNAGASGGIGYQF